MILPMIISWHLHPVSYADTGPGFVICGVEQHGWEVFLSDSSLLGWTFHQKFAAFFSDEDTAKARLTAWMIAQ